MKYGDLISRQAAVDALWKALYKYEDETEKQFQTSEDLDVGDWIEHRIFVQNMNDIDRRTILNLPSAQIEQGWIPCNWHTEEENLPQECKSVLVCIKEKSGYQIGVSYRADYNRWEGFGRANVIAWMPLPEPPEEE